MNKLVLAAKISKYIGLTKLCYFLNRNKKRVVAYHNVIPDEIWDNTFHLSHSMRLSSFKKQVEVLQKRFPIDLDIDNKKTAVITFDDGYMNQCTVASKYMDEKNIKGYFFCVGSLINEKRIFPIDLIQFWVSYVKGGRYKIIENIDVLISDNRKKSFDELENLFVTNKISVENLLRRLNELVSFESLIEKNKEMYILRFQGIETKMIEQMQRKGHKIGAHSYNHKRLVTLSKSELEEDIKICSELRESIYNTDIFCYPFGDIKDINEAVIDNLKKYKFKKAFAYRNSPLKDGQYNDYFLPRIFLHDTDDEDLIDFTLSGAKHFIRFLRLLP